MLILIIQDNEQIIKKHFLNIPSLLKETCRLISLIFHFLFQK